MLYFRLLLCVIWLSSANDGSVVVSIRQTVNSMIGNLLAITVKVSFLPKRSTDGCPLNFVRDRRYEAFLMGQNHGFVSETGRMQTGFFCAIVNISLYCLFSIRQILRKCFLCEMRRRCAFLLPEGPVLRLLEKNGNICGNAVSMADSWRISRRHRADTMCPRSRNSPAPDSIQIFQQLF